MSCCVVKCSLRTVVGEMVDFVVVGAAAISAGEVTTCCCFSCCCFEFPTSIRNGFEVCIATFVVVVVVAVAGVDFPAQVDAFEDSFFASNSLATRSISSSNFNRASST